MLNKEVERRKSVFFDILSEKCHGRSQTVKIKKGTYESDWFECDSERGKSEAIIDVTTFAGTGPEPPILCDKGCKDDETEECSPISLKQSTVKGKADLGIAQVTLHGKQMCKYVLSALEDSEVKWTTECKCLPKAV